MEVEYMDVSGGKPVVLVEDEDMLRRLFGTLLERASLPYVAFATADEAFSAITNGEVEPGLIISDIIMPGTMNGFQFRQKMGDLHPEIPFLSMSGKLPDDVSEEDFPPGQFARKPFNPATSMIDFVRQFYQP